MIIKIVRRGDTLWVLAFLICYAIVFGLSMVPSFPSRQVGIMVRTSRCIGTIGLRSFTIYSVYVTYILLLSSGKYYIGQTNDIHKRLIRHQTGQVRSTKHFRPVQLLYTEKFTTRSESMIREKYLKSLKSHVALHTIIHSDDGPIV